MSTYYDENKEIREAVYAGRRALSTADAILDELRKAKGWGIFDLIGGGFLSGIIKHSHLEKVSYLVPQLRGELDAFAREIGDVRGAGHIDAYVGTFWTATDLLCDDIISDAVVLSRISEIMRQVEQAREEVIEALNRLHKA